MEMFPILGGRLLKTIPSGKGNSIDIVSNPWREAIEARTSC